MQAMVGARGFALAADRAGGGVYCGADGVLIGPVPLLKRGSAASVWSVRPLDELNDELSAHYGLPIDIAAKANALTLIAHALNRGDLAMAAIAAVQMQLPDLPLAKVVESQDQVAKRAGELRRVGLLKFSWDPLKHPRAGVAPNAGWFAPTEGDAPAAQTTPRPELAVLPNDAVIPLCLASTGGLGDCLGGQGGIGSEGRGTDSDFVKPGGEEGALRPAAPGEVRPEQAHPEESPASSSPAAAASSAAAGSPSNALPTSPTQLGHIFREVEGHLPDTPANRELLENVANDPGAVLGPDRYGTVWSGKILPDGTQAWTQTRNGRIINGGLNQTPLTFDPETGLSAPNPPHMSKQGKQMATMTDKQAYAAMFYFLDQLYERTKSDDLAGFLGGMSLLADGGTADPAVAVDWQKAVEYALKGGEAGSLNLRPPGR